MRDTDAPNQDDVRSEVRAWLAANAPTAPRPDDGPAMRDFDLAWQRRKHAAGWAGIAWPRAHGGRGLTLAEQVVWYEECARARAPGVGALNIALDHAGPTVMAHGTPEQKAFHLPRILRGEVLWCQGFSEPGAGSDLAGLRLKGVVEGEEIVVTGQKAWSSHAHLADYQELLIRTGPTTPRHAGITWAICDMRAPGITVRPVRTMAGNHHFCDVFYDGVRIPLANVVGGLGNGWRIAMSTLSFERGSLAVGRSAELSRFIEELVATARDRALPGCTTPAIADGEFAARLAGLRAEAAALRATVYATVTAAMAGAAPGTEGVMDYLAYAELLQRAREAAMELLGAEALDLAAPHAAWVRGYLADRMYVIAGGSAEIRRNIIAERGLGLPRAG
jgi:alkylation response protein AidB-like acyl-CoA dehydrogenase